MVFIKQIKKVRYKLEIVWHKCFDRIIMEGIYAYADQSKVYKAILDATQEVQKWLRYHSGKIKIKNHFAIYLLPSIW